MLYAVSAFDLHPQLLLNPRMIFCTYIDFSLPQSKHLQTKYLLYLTLCENLTTSHLPKIFPFKFSSVNSIDYRLLNLIFSNISSTESSNSYLSAIGVVEFLANFLSTISIK